MGIQTTDRRSAVKKIKQLIYTPKSDTLKFRKIIEDTFSIVDIPNNVERIITEIADVSCEKLIPDVCSKKRVMLYIHGGSFVGGSAKAYRGFCASLANATSTKTIVPNYSLAPEYPFPKGFDDLKKILNELKKEKDKKIVLVADSSGASLALALVQDEISNNNTNTFSQIILISPIVNISKDSLIFSVRRAKDEVVSSDCIKRQADVYTYESNLQNPLVSPIYCEFSVLQKFPPVYIQCGSSELFYPEILRFSENLRLANIDYELDVWTDMIHLFQMADEFLPEAHLAIEKIGKYIKAE
ncbi:MAG: alpha/beta hydrolase [Treponema sp.]|nr:alpha/beta hydrolase [Treponema sp.]